ncbi:putative permease of the major facilitator superfamily [Klebsiella pneumoniae subsp. pneumoniae]|uniref:Putative permease of the major facilitator superfamily n=1 Tax=Klebsiella pneumoniae subsp. pneumoniae TaxID=72407 RepID=A0A377ZN51_KLEPN|nr:putative permease of the major facilitator superfamily [Klebsiella pneumoniae subsp. pneumoniae]
MDAFHGSLLTENGEQHDDTQRTVGYPKYGKWRQLVLGLICMAAISSPQYVWTLLTKPLAAKLGVGLPELQVTFSLLIILQTFFSPFQGRLVENLARGG